MNNTRSGKEDIFSLATMLYMRLRKVNSRVIDVMYLMQDRNYADHVLQIALETKDAELQGYVERLAIALDLPYIVQQPVAKKAPAPTPVAAQKTKKDAEENFSFSLF